MSEPFKETDNQNHDWLENLLSQTNFDAKIIDSIPLYESNLPTHELSKQNLIDELKHQAKEQLIKLLKDRDATIRESAAFALSGNQDLDTQRCLLLLAKNQEERFEHRIAAIKSLQGSFNIEVKTELASFLTSPKAAKSYLSTHNSQASLNFNDKTSPEHIKNKQTRIQQRQQLLLAAVDSLGPIQHPDILKIISKAKTSGFFGDLKDFIAGVSDLDRELSLHAALTSLGASCAVLQPKTVSRLILDGLRSEQQNIRNAALLAALHNPKNLTNQVHKEVLKIALKIPDDEFKLEPTASIGEILYHAKSKAIRVGVQKLLRSTNEVQRTIGMIASTRSKDMVEINLTADILQYSKSRIEQGLAIHTLGSCLNEESPDYEFIKRILLKNLLFLNEAKIKNRVLLIEALTGTSNKSFLDLCFDYLGEDDEALARAAMNALSKDNSSDVTHKLLGILELKEDKDRTLKSRAAEVLSQRLDSTALQHLRQTLEMGDDLECIYAMSALRGTTDSLALNYMLDIAGDRTRHFETRADAIYSVDKAINTESNPFDKQFIKKISNLLEPIIANPLEDKMVRISAINAVPKSAPLRLLNQLLSIAKKDDLDLKTAALNKLSNFDHAPIQEFFLNIYSEGSNLHHQNLGLKNISKTSSLEGIKLLLRDILNPESTVRSRAIRVFREIFLPK